jgi:KUP system potassium uptake protein
VVTVKYVLLIMRADNRGEGGIMALTALAQRHLTTERGRWVAVLFGIAGASLFFGDGMITPAISVLSAIDGLKVVSPAFEVTVLPLSVAILVALFLVQNRGTAVMDAIFGPVCAVWFIAIGSLGLAEIVTQPGVLAALLPTYAVGFAISHGLAAFVAFGSVFLAVTGAEALYADMGHFGRRPIARMWTLFVLPALALNYFGQGALILNDPASIENPFYLLAPEWFRLPLVFLAAAATIIASQAVISGAYSLARQCVQLGFLPHLIVRHTSGTEEGQIYLPQVNVALPLGVLFLVSAFKTSDGLAAAYGIAVTGTFICTTLLAMVVFRGRYRWSVALVALVFGPLLTLDILFFVSNALKIPDGGWVPLLFGAAMLVLMTTWGRGRSLLFSRIRQQGLPLTSFISGLAQSRVVRVPASGCS